MVKNTVTLMADSGYSGTSKTTPPKPTGSSHKAQTPTPPKPTGSSHKAQTPTTKVVYQTVPAETSYSGDSGGGGSYESYWNKMLENIKRLFREQYDQANKQAKTLYEQRILNNKTDWENDRNQANLNFRNAQRYLNSAYGDAVSGMGLTNKARNYSNWNNRLTDINKNYTNNDASALADYNSNLSNNANVLADAWLNRIIPVYTQRIMHKDNLNAELERIRALQNL